jgi:hypothetical protein
MRWQTAPARNSAQRARVTQVWHERARPSPMIKSLITNQRCDLLFWLARLAGFEPATGCLEDMAWLSGNVLHLGFAVLGVCRDTPAARLAGVAYGCQAGAACPSRCELVA